MLDFELELIRDVRFWLKFFPSFLMLNSNLAPPHVIFSTFCSIEPCTVTAYDIFVNLEKPFVTVHTMQKLAAFIKTTDNQTRTVFVSYMSDWILDNDFDKKKHVKFFL